MGPVVCGELQCENTISKSSVQGLGLWNVPDFSVIVHVWFLIALNNCLSTSPFLYALVSIFVKQNDGSIQFIRCL